MDGSDLIISSSRATGPTLSRRTALKSGLAAGLAAVSTGTLLSACTDNGDGADGPLRFGAWAYIPTVIDLDKIINDYTAANEGSEITLGELSTDITNADSFVQKFTLEARQESASYDIIFGPTPWIETAPLAEAGGLAPLDDLMDDLIADLVGPAREGVIAADGKVYSLPTWTDVVGFIYRSDLLEQYAGRTEPPATWDEVVSVAQSMQSKLPSGMYAYGADWNFMHRMFLPIFVTLTDAPFRDDGVVNMEGTAPVQTLEYIKTLYEVMPPNANQNLGSSEVFQAGNLVMESYWQPQLTRAVTAGVDESVVVMASNPSGNRDSTVFWTTDVVIPAYATQQEVGAAFWRDGMINNSDAIQASIDTAGKIPPFTSVLDSVTLPEFMQPLADQLVNGTAIPMSTAFLTFEQPAFKEQVERMILEDQSPEVTAENLRQAFDEGQAG